MIMYRAGTTTLLMSLIVGLLWVTRGDAGQVAQPASDAPSIRDTFGDPGKPPADVKSDEKKPEDGDAEASGDESVEDEADKEPVDPEVVFLHLSDGTRVAGKLSVDAIEVDTRFGSLSIPITKIRRLQPGLDSNPDLDRRIGELVDQLGSDEFATRESAHKELLQLGPVVLNELGRRGGDGNAERDRHLKKLTEELRSLAEEMEFEAEDEYSLQPLRRGDTVYTTSFSVVGTIRPQKFKFNSRYGQLALNLADIYSASRDTDDEEDEVRKALRLEGTNVVQRGMKSTGIRVHKGDKVLIRATGKVTMPQRNNYTSTPEGHANLGTYVNNIYSGALVAQIGNGSIFKAGANHSFVAKENGVLKVAIAMRSSYVRYALTGGYNVAVRVERRQKH